MRKFQLVALALVILSFLTAGYFYSQLPDKMATHWNFDGKVDGYMGKDFGVFFLPFLCLAMLALFFYLPKLDPLKKNYALFQKEYDGLVAILVGFMYYVYLLSLFFNLGYGIDMMQALSLGFAILFYYLGIIIGKAKQNWFVGIRTPWTMSSTLVWDKTHAICGKLFKAAGIVALLGLVVPKIGLLASVGVVIATAVFSFVYSYLEFQKERKRK